MITDYTRLINKEYPLPPDYVPPDLTTSDFHLTVLPAIPKHFIEKGLHMLPEN